jgi:RNA polymerase sigma-70 factor (ECF subfamily)
LFTKTIFSPPNAQTDTELVEKFKNSHDVRYLGDLYQRYLHLVYGVCLKYLKNTDDSKDATMEIFEKLVIELKRHEITYFKSWLYELSRNHCLGRLRKQTVDGKQSKKFIEDTFMENNEEAHHIIDQEINDALKITSLQDALRNLPEAQRTCIELFYYQNKSYQDISDQTQMSLAQVKSYIQNGRRNLKNYINQRNFS